VTALDTAAGSITIQSSDDGSETSFTFAIPSGFALPDGLAVGGSVEARGDIVSGVLTLTRIKLEDDGSDG
jgi:hypothetical protein